MKPSFVIYHERRVLDGSNYKVYRSSFPIISGKVNIEGSRAVDNARFTVRSGEVDVRIDEEMFFIADDVPVNHLAHAFNFYHNIRDEAGHNIDGVRIDSSDDPFYGTETDTDSRYLGHKYLDCTSTKLDNADPPSAIDTTQVIRCKQSEYENNKHVFEEFDEGREIQIHCKVPTLAQWGSNNSTQIIYSRGLHSGSNAGIEIGLKHNASEDKTYAYLKQKVYNGSSTEEDVTGEWSDLLVSSSSDSDAHAKDCYIRVRRKDDQTSGSTRYNRNEIMVNENTYGNENYVSSSGYSFEQSGVTKDIYIGSDGSSQNKFKGKIYSIRVYSGQGAEFSDADASVVWKRLLPQSIMKFGGKISDIVHRGTYDDIHVVGYSAVLLKTEIDKDLFTIHQATSPKGYSNGSGIYWYRQGGSSDDQKKETLLENIVKDIVVNINANRLDTTGVNTSNGHWGKDIPYEFSYNNDGDEDDIAGTNSGNYYGFDTTSYSHPRNVNRYDAGGRFIDTLRILAALGNKWYASDTTTTLFHLKGADQFFTLPRKVLVFESSDIPTNNYFSTINGYRIHDDGYDDSNTSNEVIVFGESRESKIRYSFTKSNGLTSPAWNTTNRWDLQWKIDNDESNKILIGLDYIEKNGNMLDPITANYTWNGREIIWGSNVTGGSNSDEYTVVGKLIDLTTTNFLVARNTTLIKEHGQKSRKYYIPQLDDLTTCQAVCRRILGAKADRNKEARLTIPRISNAIGMGQEVTLDHGGKGMYNEEFTVKKITYNLPQGSTVVECGDYAYDVMDDLKDLTQDISSFLNEKKTTN